MIYKEDDEDDDDDNKLGGWAIFGIVAGGVIAVTGIAFAIVFFIKKKSGYKAVDLAKQDNLVNE